MKSIALIAYYGGKLPIYIHPWLATCAANPTIDFLLIVDDECNIDLPANVKKYHITLDALKQRIQKLYDFPIQLPRAYKVCDFRPAFGEIFEDILAGYDYWGHCDIDMLFGNLRNFLTEKILCSHDRIFTVGPLSLYKNTSAVNSYYRTLCSENFLNYRDVFSSEKHYCYDEWAANRGFSAILYHHNIPVYREPKSYDIISLWWGGARLQYNNTTISYVHFCDGRLLLYRKNQLFDEVPYIHMSGRLQYLYIQKNLDDNFYFLPVAHFVKNINHHLFFRCLQYAYCNARVPFFHIHNFLGAQKNKLLILLNTKGRSVKES